MYTQVLTDTEANVSHESNNDNHNQNDSDDDNGYDKYNE